MTVNIRSEWDNPDWSEAIAKARRDDPEYDRVWREGLQRMADDWDCLVAERIYRQCSYAFSCDTHINNLGGIAWRGGEPIYVSGDGREITRAELLSRLTPEQIAQVEEAERHPPVASAQGDGAGE